MTRLLAIGLDGYEPSFGDQLMRDGEMPNLARLHQRSAIFGLDHGRARDTGLAWEHFSSGLSPDAANRWSAVKFDRETYSVRQEGARTEPFLASVDVDAAIFDVPYFDLSRSPRVEGLTAWGAHDPGVAISSNPGSLLLEVQERFGDYPAPEWIYGFGWPSAEKCKAMGDALAQSVDLRARIARWLFGERLSDWEFAVMVVSELHSASEPLWHGIAPDHPLAQHPSAPAARASMHSVYAATDRLIGELASSFPDATLVVFSLHGMGSNKSDVPNMALLPELLFRHEFGRSALIPPPASGRAAGGIPLLEPDQGWDVEIAPPVSALQRFRGRPVPWYEQPQPEGSLAWMPAARYQPYWKKMRAFALPSFYDGQVRINLRGREARGRVSLQDYEKVRMEIAELLQGCRDPLTGDRVVADITFSNHCPPLELDSSAADLVVAWHGCALAFEHPQIGVIGPVPIRRTGGHTGGIGTAWFLGSGFDRRDHGVYSAFDLVPTLIEMLGRQVPPHLSGKSMLDRGGATGSTA